MGADEGTAGEEQGPAVRVEAPEAFRRGFGHAGAVKIVHEIVADGLSVHQVIKAPVIFRVVGEAAESAAQAPGGLISHAALPQGIHLREGVGDAFVGIEEGGFVHIVPEALDPGLQQGTVQTAEPAADVLPQEIREDAAAGPDRRDEIAPVLLFAETVPGFAGIVRGIAFLHFDPRVDDGYQAEMILFHLPGEPRQVRESVRLPGEVFEVHHIVDIHADRVQGDMPFPVFGNDRADFLLAGVAPAALDISESPAGREIAAAGKLPERAGDPGEGIPLDQIHVQVPVHGGDDRPVPAGITQVPDDLSRIVEEDPQEPIRAEEDQEVMAAVEGGLRLGMVEDVAVPALIAVAALVHAAHRLPQAEEHLVRPQGKGEGNAAVFAGLHVKKGQGTGLRGQMSDDGAGGKGRAEGIFPDHRVFLACRCGKRIVPCGGNGGKRLKNNAADGTIRKKDRGKHK